LTKTSQYCFYQTADSLLALIIKHLYTENKGALFLFLLLISELFLLLYSIDLFLLNLFHLLVLLISFFFFFFC
jgi:hypothetical protein